jgi:ribosomal subunit interface protein
MNIRIKATNITLSEQLSDYINKALSKVSKTVDSDPTVQCDVEVGRTTNHHQKGEVFMAEIHVVGTGLDAYARTEHEDLNAAITETRDEVMSKIRTMKGKRISFIRRSGARAKDMLRGLWPWK